MSNFICIKKTNYPILEYQAAEISDSGLNISEISSNTNLNQFKNFEKWNSNLLTFTEINRNEEAEFAHNNPGKRQPERLLFVLHLNDYQHLKVPFKERLQTVKTQLRQIKYIEDAFNFISSYGHLYHETYFYFNKMETIEFLISKSLSDEDIAALESKSEKEKEEWLSKFRLRLKEIVKKNLETNNNYFLVNNLPPNVNAKVYSLHSRLNLPKDEKNDLYFNTNVKNNSNFDIDFWQNFCSQSKDPRLFDLLDQATKLLKKIFAIETEWSYRIDSRDQLSGFYLRNVAFRDAFLRFLPKKEKIDSFKELESRTNQACDYFDMLVKASFYLITRCLYKPEKFHYLYDKKLLEYLDFDMKYLLIYHSPALILEMNNSSFGLNRIIETLEKMFNVQSNVGPKVKFIFIDYDLHLNEVCDLYGKQLLEMDFLHKNIHFDLNDKNFVMPPLVNESLDISFRFLVGVPRLDEIASYNLKELNLSNNCLVAIDIYNFRTTSANIKTLLLKRNLITHIERNTFENMVNMESLNLSSNFLYNIDKQLFAKNVNLTFLDLSNNRLTSIEMETFKSLKSLRVLKLSSNLLKLIDSGTFDCLTNLEDLFVDNNLIQILSENVFEKMFSLKKLYLNNNCLKNLSDKTFSTLRELNILDLSFNKISNLTCKSFSDLRKLKQLNLQGNCIASFEREHFKELRNLRVLLIHSNVVSFIENDTFVDLMELKVLTLFNNHLTKQFNHERIRKSLKKLKRFYYSHEQTKLKDLLVYEKIKKYFI